MKDWVDIAREPRGFRVAPGLEVDRNGTLQVILSPNGPLYYDGKGINVRASDGVEVSPGSPVALRSTGEAVDFSEIEATVEEAVTEIEAADIRPLLHARF